MLLGQQAMPAVSRCYGVEPLPRVGAAAHAHAAAHDQQWADGHTPPVEDDVSLYSVQTADTHQDGGSPRDDHKHGVLSRIARPMSARKMLDAASSIGSALRRSYQSLPTNLPSPRLPRSTNRPAPRLAFGPDDENGFTPSVSTPTPSIPSSPTVPTAPATWVAAPPPPPQAQPLCDAAPTVPSSFSDPSTAAASANQPGDENADADVDVPILATPPRVLLPATPRPDEPASLVPPRAASDAAQAPGGGASEGATGTAPEAAREEADGASEATAPAPERAASRLDQLEQRLNEMHPRGAAKSTANKSTAKRDEAETDAPTAGAAGAEAAASDLETELLGFCGPWGCVSAATEASVVGSEDESAPEDAAVGTDHAAEGGTGPVEASAGVTGEAAAGERAGTARVEAAAAAEAVAAEAVAAVAVAEAPVGDFEEATASVSAVRSDQTAEETLRAATDASSSAGPAEANGEMEAREQPAVGHATTTTAPDVETQPPPPLETEVTPAKLRRQSSRLIPLEMDRPISPGPSDFLQLERSFDAMPKLGAESEMARRVRSSFSNSAASAPSSASTSLKRWQRATSFDAEVAADLDVAAHAADAVVSASAAGEASTSHTTVRQKERQLCSPVAVLPSPQSNIVSSAPAAALGVARAAATTDGEDTDEDEEESGAGADALFGSALKGADTPTRKKPVKQASRKLVFGSGGGFVAEDGGGAAEAAAVGGLTLPEPTECPRRPQQPHKVAAKGSTSTISSLLNHAPAAAAAAVADLLVESELVGENPDSSAPEYGEEQEGEFLRDWQKQRAGRGELKERGRVDGKDADEAAVMEELRRMETDAHGGCSSNQHPRRIISPVLRLLLHTRGLITKVS